MKIGVGRVSTLDQNLDAQEDALRAYGCDKVFVDKRSGRRRDRPGITAALEMARPGDSIVVTKLNRLGRSFRDLVNIAAELEERSIDLVVLDLQMDTSTPMGRAMWRMSAVFAELEVDWTRERTLEGLEAARKRGRKGGRPPKLTINTARAAVRFYDESDATWTQVAAEFGVSRRTLMTWVDRVRAEKAGAA